MSKVKTSYVCQNCGAEYTSWMGRCGNCQSWNSIIELTKETPSSLENVSEGIKLESFFSMAQDKKERWKTGFTDLDLILGGGMVKGSLVLLSGEPGMGKSTLLLQVVKNLVSFNPDFKVLYISGEESVPQIQLRSFRLGLQKEIKTDNENLLVGAESNVDKIIYSIRQKKPSVLIIDSIQTIYSEHLNSYPGSVSQVRYCANEIMRIIKKEAISTFLVGQVTKEGIIAGPKVLEHLVDVVLQIEGSDTQDLRLLRSLKNRFGSTEEIGILQMQEDGLKEVLNPSAIFLNDSVYQTPGSVKTVFLEGKRCLLVDIQALVVPNYFPPLHRTATGIDYKRLLLLVAVLEKHSGLKLQNKDLYVKVSGGLKLEDPATDLAVCLAILSAEKNRVINSKVVAIGEIGLLGEVRQVKQLKKRMNEAQKQGFDQVISVENAKNLYQAEKKLSW